MTNSVSEVGGVGDAPGSQTGQSAEIADHRKAPAWASRIATVFGIGYLKPGPGTWGSLAAVLMWAVLGGQLPPGARACVCAGAALAVILIGIPAATAVSRACRGKDPQFVVIDEVAGQLITLIAAPIAWKSFIAGFILFRVFDILKPPPVRQLERLPEGAGIVLDDVGAGIYGVAVMHLLLHFHLLIG